MHDSMTTPTPPTFLDRELILITSWTLRPALPQRAQTPLTGERLLDTLHPVNWFLMMLRIRIAGDPN